MASPILRFWLGSLLVALCALSACASQSAAHHGFTPRDFSDRVK
jgi:hypothetical protein